MEIWVNPACTKCRAATAALDAAGIAYTVRRYLDDPPTRAELDGVLDRLGLEPWDVARPKEAARRRHRPPDATPTTATPGWTALAAHPRAIQRPIITADDGTTVVGRDPEALAERPSAAAPCHGPRVPPWRAWWWSAAGFGGLATAARLAKLGHEVTLRRGGCDRLGGALGFVEQDGFRWDAGPTQHAAARRVRDLFRKSGRPLERELDLVPVEPMRRAPLRRRHPCSTCPCGSRAAQIAAVDAALGAGLGRRVGGVRRRTSPRPGRCCAGTSWSGRGPPSTPSKRTRRRCCAAG